MDLRRFLDLYASESQEHLRLLHRSLLAVEGGSPGAIDEAFRAAHTLKGLSAAMGYGAVADIAHVMEDRLEEIRSGRAAADAAVVDLLLRQADELENAVAASVTAGTSGEQPRTTVIEPPAASATAPARAAGARMPAAADSTAPLPEGTQTLALVRLQQDAPIKSARAMLIMRSLADLPGVLGSRPAAFEDDFDGDFRICLAAGADTATIEAKVLGAGDVESVDFVEPAAAAAGAPARPAPPPAAPGRQLRVEAARLDGLADGIGELSVLFGRIPPDLRDTAGLGGMLDRMNAVLGDLQHDVLALRMAPLQEAFERLPRVVRDAARQVGRDVELVVTGDDVELDRAILEEIGEPLVHLLRNAVDHGIEASGARAAAGKPARACIRVTAQRERSSVRITVEDDGRGVDRARVVAKAKAAGLLPAAAPEDVSDEELFRLLSHAGLSTAETVSAVSGRGVGMDVVVSRVRALGGAIDMRTEAGAGTAFSIRLPITLAMAQALRVRVGGEDYAIPLTHVAEAVELQGVEPGADGRETVPLRSERVPLVRMRSVLQAGATGSERAAVIAEIGDRRAALAVDELLGREQILVKSFDAVTGMLPYFSGATLLADGRPALVLDPLSVI